ELFACDRDASRCREAARYGAKICTEIAELGRQVDIVIVMVGYDDEVREICGGEGGLIEVMRKGGIITICSTIKRNTMTDLVSGASLKGIYVLDTPVTRAEEGAIAGNLLLLGSGDPMAFARAKPLFRTFCSDIFHLGPAGCGQVAKICNNLLLWNSVVANCETLALAERCGLNKEELIKALMISTGTNGTLHRWEKMTMPWVHKDLSIALEFAESLGVGLPVAGLTKQLFKVFNLPRAR
ncbi:MAG TPA: NAD(P)-dependent oxidoreductase, partial [Methylocella sp.]|nr:NAD(P)-dependent oxidoreductase [Methylocella sp.]